MIDFDKELLFGGLSRRGVLDTIYVFKDQLHLVENPVWKKESLVYMAVHHPYKSQDYTKINGFHLLSASNMSRIDCLNRAFWVNCIDYSCKRNRIDFWTRKWRSWNYRNMEDQVFVEAANNNINFDGYCECKLGLGGCKKDDHFYGLQLPSDVGGWSLRSDAEKYARLFAKCFSKSGVGDASKAEVL